MGRPVSGYFDSFAAAETFSHYSEAGFHVLGTSSLNTPGYVNVTLRQPYGVVAAIIPWNVPILFLANKAAPALMAGNTVVVKSSEKAPLTVSSCHSCFVVVLLSAKCELMSVDRNKIVSQNRYAYSES